jgi:hypothetical protein
LLYIGDYYEFIVEGDLDGQECQDEKEADLDDEIESCIEHPQPVEIVVLQQPLLDNCSLSEIHHSFRIKIKPNWKNLFII